MFENDNSATTTIINNMHEEIQVALNFLISFLYNKLPRRRVNQFGEELELILKKRFIDHWYPLEPSKGSAYRCIHCNPQLDSSLFREAAQKSGLNLQDVQQNFPNELSIWIDPGEVSYRINEKGPVNILFSLNKQRLSSSLNNNNNGESSTTTTPTIINGLNPEAQCFQPESKHFIINNDSKLMINHDHHQTIQLNKSIPDIFNNHHNNNNNNNNSKNDAITFTTAAFAATKFGSTKPKVMMANRKQQQQQFQQQQQTRSIPIDGPKFLTTTTNATATNANRKFHFKQVSRANSFSNGQTFSQYHSSLTSPLSSSQQQSHSGSDLLNTVMNNLAIVNQNRHNGQSQQILNNQQQQKMRQLMQWNNNNNNEIKSAFDRDQQQQQCMLGLFEPQQPQMQRNSFDVFPPNSSNMNWNQTNQSNGGIQRSISMISDHGNDYNNGVGGNNLLLETFMPDKLLREIFEIGNNDDDQDHNHDDSNDNLLMMFNQNQSPPELISPTSEIPFGLSSTTTTTLPPLLSSSCWSSSSAVESSNNSNNNSSSITPQSLSSSSLLLNILNEFDNLSLNSTSESSSIGSIASYVQ